MATPIRIPGPGRTARLPRGAGVAIQRARLVAGISQRELGRQLALSRAAVGRLEGGAPVSVGLALRLVAALPALSLAALARGERDVPARRRGYSA